MEPGIIITPNQETGFDYFIDQVAAYIKGEELEITAGVAPTQKKEIWEQIFKGNYLPMLKVNQNNNNEILGVQIALSFIQNLQATHKTKPHKLALSQKHNKVYIWAEIADGDDVMMESILAAVIDANFEHRDSGMSLSPMIVEQSDKLSVPSHFKVL
jgi:hypothetical protein